jgi:hypothetical protein
MLQAEQVIVTRHHAYFHYGEKKILFYFWSKIAIGTKPDTILFLGTGQVGKIPSWVIHSLPAGAVVVEGLPHWHSDPSASDLLTFTHEYTQCAYQTAIDAFQLASMHIIGESQATPGAIWLANASDSVRNVALVLPMGLNTANFGTTERERFAELRKRSIRTLLQREQSPFYDLRNLYVAGLLTKIIISGLRDGSTVNKYTTGISHDMLEDFRTLVNKQRTRHSGLSLFLGGKDKLFPANEVEQSLRNSRISEVHIEVMPQLSHSTLALKSNEALLRTVVATVRQKA